MPVRAFSFPQARARQSGFSLIEVTMALALLGAMSLGVLQVQQFQQMVERGRQAGLRLAALRDGAERYVRDHGAALMAVPALATCEKVALSQGASAGAPPVTGCELKVRDKVVARNAFQPSIQELQDLGYVTFGDSLPFPHGDTIVDGHTGQPAEARWAVSVQCHANCPQTAGAGPASPTLRVLLYNTQPFFATADLPFGHGAQLKAALQVLGPDAVVSLPGESAQTAAQLRGKGVAPVPNPLKDSAPGTGVPGVLASHRLVFLDGVAVAPCGVAGAANRASGVDTGGVTCRDGSAKPTARWDFGGQDLDNVGQLGVAGNATVMGKLTAAHAVHANGGLFVRHPSNGMITRARYDGSSVTETHAVVDVGGHAVIRKKLVVGAGDHAYPFDPNDDKGMLLNGSLIIRDGFVDVSSLQRGGEAFDPRLSGIRIPHRSPDQPCNQSHASPKISGGNIALYHQANSEKVYVMACNSQGRWVKAG
ncbi:MAG: type II secretion system protein [Rubrivivax sp.]|nr:MAG: type II secretion system protein [Rubrivivax sp.]